MKPNFVIFHQPKTAGTYASHCLPKNYVLHHYMNYHYCLTHNLLSENTKLVCIVRNPLDYYISLITFWCLDPKYCSDIRNKSIRTLHTEYELNKMNQIGHPNYWISCGFTKRNLNDILENMFCDTFLHNHKNKLSKKHHTYDNYVFSTMLRLDIGFYTFAFLEQFSRKKVSEIKTTEECRNEINYIYDNFITLHTNTISKELKDLCLKYSVPFHEKVEKQKVSNRKHISEYNISDELIAKIKYKDRYMLEIFNLKIY